MKEDLACNLYRYTPSLKKLDRCLRVLENVSGYVLEKCYDEVTDRNRIKHVGKESEQLMYRCVTWKEDLEVCK